MRFRNSILYVICFTIAASVSVMAQIHTDVSDLADRPNVRKAFDYLREIEPETIEEQVKIAEIPAPTFQEEKRGAYYKRRFEELGLKSVRVDEAGNVIGERPGSGGAKAPTLVVVAHLDTVFPIETKLEAVREGKIIRLPGIGDDARGLAVLLAVVRALNEHSIETVGDLIFVGVVGEEGLGDLKGTRHLFEKELKGRITHFISLDGAGLGVTVGAVGSKRYRVTYSGPGGHSFGAFGMANPIHALGRLIEKVSRFETPSEPKTTFSVGVIRGGTSINSIAHTASFDIDMRSVDPQELAKLDAKFQAAAKEARDEENTRWNNRDAVELSVEKIGDRPAGRQAPDSPIIRLSSSANKHMGIEDDFGFSSTDSNIPMSIGIPAVTLDIGGKGYKAHSPDEYWDSTESHVGSQRTLLIVLGVVGVK